jgi:hypothetical protein
MYIKQTAWNHTVIHTCYIFSCIMISYIILIMIIRGKALTYCHISNEISGLTMHTYINIDNTAKLIKFYIMFHAHAIIIYYIQN